MKNRIEVVRATADDIIKELLRTKGQAGLELLDIVPLFGVAVKKD
ncbi:MAG: hypothetical protein ACM3X9_04910 [Bacillota bacterium]